MSFRPSATSSRPRPPVLSVRNFSWAGRLNDISFDVRPGEVVGLGGLDGQGQRQLLLGLFGTLIGASGTVEVDGKPVRLSSPQSAQSHRTSAWR